jgi:two-component system, cell cycle sensor histidine kinase and response regulator CckA
MMPDMDGLAVLGKLRETDPRVRVIATSGLPVTDRGAEILVASQVTFLPKPYTDEQLLEVLGDVTRSP